jgi:predicted nucleotidyltransferase component of viral defense system
MLHLKTVEPYTFSILEELLNIPDLKDFALVGGTALSLMYGHRISEDLDLFSNKPFENIKVIEILKSKYKDSFVTESKPAFFGIFGYIDNVKIDIVRHPHPLIRPINTIDGIRMFSTEDIIAMKVQAIFGRGKKKDFWDIAELLQHYSVDDFCNFHKEKYSTQDLLISIPQAMTYFVDADDSEDPISMKNQTWSSVKKFISTKVSSYLQ